MINKGNKHPPLSLKKKDFKEILNELPVIVLITDQQGKILYGNSQIEKELGYTPPDLEGSYIWQLYNDEHRDHDFFKALFRKLVTGKVLSFDTQALHRQGARVLLAVKVKLIKRLTGSRVVLCIASDVSHSRKLESQILDIAENERLRIGQELHDSAGQMLSAIGLMIQSRIRNLKKVGSAVTEELDEILEMVQQTDTMIRKLSHGFSFTYLDPDSDKLQTAIQHLCDRYSSVSGVECEFKYSTDLEFKDKTMVLHLFRIVQEAIHNSIKHGSANSIRIGLDYEDHFLKLYIEDNGAGLRELRDKGDNSGIGIDTMKYRAEILGGHLELLTTSDGWTRVECLIPFVKQ